MAALVVIARLPTTRSLLSYAALAAGYEVYEAADFVTGTVALVQHNPDVLLLGEDQVGLDVTRYLATIATHFPNVHRLVLVEQIKKAKFGLKGNSTSQLEILLPTSRRDVEALAAQLHALL